jgi:hypothetical protein
MQGWGEVQLHAPRPLYPRKNPRHSFKRWTDKRQRQQGRGKVAKPTVESPLTALYRPQLVKQLHNLILHTVHAIVSYTQVYLATDGDSPSVHSRTNNAYLMLPSNHMTHRCVWISNITCHRLVEDYNQQNNWPSNRPTTSVSNTETSPDKNRNATKGTWNLAKYTQP